MLTLVLVINHRPGDRLTPANTALAWPARAQTLPQTERGEGTDLVIFSDLQHS